MSAFKALLQISEYGNKFDCSYFQQQKRNTNFNKIVTQCGWYRKYVRTTNHEDKSSLCAKNFKMAHGMDEIWSKIPGSYSCSLGGSKFFPYEDPPLSIKSINEF